MSRKGTEEYYSPIASLIAWAATGLGRQELLREKSPTRSKVDMSRAGVIEVASRLKGYIGGCDRPTMLGCWPGTSADDVRTVFSLARVGLEVP